MPLVEKQLFETVDKVTLGIDRLREFEPPEGYWLAFSGGKDSTVIHQLAVEAGVGFVAHYNVTTMDPPPLIRHMHRHYPNLVWDKAENRLEALLLKKGFPPMRHQRWCCEHFKESHGEGILIQGVRAEESAARKKRGIFEACYKTGKRHFVNPIIDWTALDVWEFIRSRGLPYCKLYDQGYKRLGCVMCPCATKKTRLRDASEFPAMKRRLVRAFQKLVEYRRSDGHKPFRNWQTGQELFDWWIMAESKVKTDPNQRMMFDN